jgi:tellurite resistance protein
VYETLMSAPGPVSVRDFDEPKLHALIEVMFLAAYSDGEFSEEERKHFTRSVQALTDMRLTDDRFDRLLASIQADFQASGRDARLQVLKASLPDAGSRKVALSLAIQVMMADGILRTAERELIFEVADVLEIDRDLAANMVAGMTSV